MHPCPDQGWAELLFPSSHLCSRLNSFLWMPLLKVHPQKLVNHLQIWRKLNLWHRQNILNTIAEVSPEDYLWTPGRSFGALDLPSLCVWQLACLAARQSLYSLSDTPDYLVPKQMTDGLNCKVIVFKGFLFFIFTIEFLISTVALGEIKSIYAKVQPGNTRQLVIRCSPISESLKLY